MNSNQILEVFRLLSPDIADLLGGRAAVRVINRTRLNPKLENISAGGAKVFNKSLLGYSGDINGNPVFIEFNRPELPFSETEQRLIDQLFKGLTALIRGFNDPSYAIHHRAAILSSVFDIAISRFLRQHKKHFAYIQQIIQITKALTFKRYEGAPCTSGFLFVNKPKKGFAERLRAAGFRITILNPTIKVDARFFESPLAYRYVDGMRSIYLTQSPSTCIGIIQLDPNRRLTREDITNHIPFRTALQVTESQSFCIIANENSETDVMYGSGDFFRWRKGSWTLIEFSRLISLFRECLLSGDTARLLAEVVLRTSASRHGALILLLMPDCEAPSFVRHIDNTEVGKVLRAKLLNLRVEDAYQTGVFYSALTSDGLTVIDQEGIVRDSGALIDLRGVTSGIGGGRTAAAESASNYGIAVKISEDGPIHIWRSGKLILQLA
jgi:hypothetical protein